eukprot:TRINITY_DN314_c0_g1_i1.p2 TRINITY_DN314_c0_g1~~TRINITY_DN314_c0_g1_i1.p2  ORF type:complete len:51 (-),score=3.37 TRINITY_DN314_c0_g1_i1:408-560(-)
MCVFKMYNNMSREVLHSGITPEACVCYLVVQQRRFFCSEEQACIGLLWGI